MTANAELTVVMVSYNTRDLTLAALCTLFDTTVRTNIRVVVFDNASSDGSAEAVAQAFPEVELIQSEKNLGFALANNIAIEKLDTDYVLLLNPDTECHAGAVDKLMEFAKKNPKAGIWGGRTVFPDGSLNVASCWNKITLWSMFCRASGLFSIFRNTELFNPEGIGGWKRDSVRCVDIVVGCFLLTRTNLWRQLDGFDPKYFMYGEEADLCLRAASLGYRPMITPDAEIMHLIGAAMSVRTDKHEPVAKARATLIRDHWPKWKVPLGIGLMWLAAAFRTLVAHFLGVVKGGKQADQARLWRRIWRSRRDWLSGY